MNDKFEKGLVDAGLLLSAALWFFWAYAFLGDQSYEALLMAVGGVVNVMMVPLRRHHRLTKTVRWALVGGVFLLNAFCMFVTVLFVCAFVIVFLSPV